MRRGARRRMSDTPPSGKPSKQVRPVRPRGLGRRKKDPLAQGDYAIVEKTRVDRRAEVFGLRTEGVHWRVISEKLNLSIGQCMADFEKARAEYSLESIEQLRAVFNARMDLNHARLNANIAKLNDIIQRHAEIVSTSKDGCVASARIVVEASACKAGLMAEQRMTALAVMKMNGAEAALKVEHSGNVPLVINVSSEIARAFAPPALTASDAGVEAAQSDTIDADGVH